MRKKKVLKVFCFVVGFNILIWYLKTIRTHLYAHGVYGVSMMLPVK